ncbi:MAG: ABC transporter ATP-binding protein [Gaiellaceae bacterium]
MIDLVQASLPTPSSGGVPGDGPLAACRDVSVHYGQGDAGVAALSRIDLSFDQNERIALWGRSGSGKTTLLHVLGGLVTPSTGSVEWRGAPLTSLDAAARTRARSARIAYVFQGSNLLPTFTAFENVAFAARSAVAPDHVAGRAEEMLSLVGLSSKLDALPAELSGGEGQRVAIARALAQQPELLLCDEPTGHLDSDTAARVLDLIEQIQERQRFTLVVATHDADVAARLDRRVELLDGRIVEQGRR